MNKTEIIYQIVSQIPPGKVATYGQIAKMAQTGARVVGNALHKNPDSNATPCYRVVNRNGELSEKYAFGGRHKQFEKLRDDGVIFVGDRVDLRKYLWQPD
jgi:methylated-DNA-protein-cysteine methyltransferase-like protein